MRVKSKAQKLYAAEEIILSAAGLQCRYNFIINKSEIHKLC
jgi:hypothetical protein